MAIEVRVCSPDEVGGALNPIWHYFGATAKEEDVERFAPILPAERVHAAFDGGAIVGGAGAYLFETTVPGGAQVPTAGVMAVGVLPTHRRRGVLTKLMERQLADAHERGEPLATLYASEGAIYSRFGYGLASLAGGIELPKEHALLWDDEPIGQARIIETEEETLELLPGIYDRVQAETVGMFTRTPDWWKVRRLGRSPMRSGGEQVRVAVELDGALEAYALYRLNFSARHMIAETTLEVGEALGHVTAGSRRDLAVPARDRLGGADRGVLGSARPPALPLAARAAPDAVHRRRSGLGATGRHRSCARGAELRGRSDRARRPRRALPVESRRAGASRTEPSSARPPRPTCGWASPSSVPSTWEASRSTSSAGRDAWRS